MLNRVFDALVSTVPGVEDKECAGVVVVMSDTEEMRRKHSINASCHFSSLHTPYTFVCVYHNKRARTSIFYLQENFKEA
jgi:hypothetical protein